MHAHQTSLYAQVRQYFQTERWLENSFTLNFTVNRCHFSYRPLLSYSEIVHGFISPLFWTLLNPESSQLQSALKESVFPPQLSTKYFAFSRKVQRVRQWSEQLRTKMQVLRYIINSYDYFIIKRKNQYFPKWLKTTMSIYRVPVSVILIFRTRVRYQSLLKSSRDVRSTP